MKGKHVIYIVGGIIGALVISAGIPLAIASRTQGDWLVEHCEANMINDLKVDGQTSLFKVDYYGEQLECTAEQPTDWWWNYKNFLGF